MDNETILGIACVPVLLIVVYLVWKLFLGAVSQTSEAITRGVKRGKKVSS